MSLTVNNSTAVFSSLSLQLFSPFCALSNPTPPTSIQSTVSKMPCPLPPSPSTLHETRLWKELQANDYPHPTSRLWQELTPFIVNMQKVHQEWVALFGRKVHMDNFQHIPTGQKSQKESLLFVNSLDFFSRIYKHKDLRSSAEKGLDYQVLPESLSIDENLFQHILGSHFGRYTGLESYSAPEMLNYLLTILEQKLLFLKTYPPCDEQRDHFCHMLGVRKIAFEEMVEQFKKAREINKSLDSSDVQEFFNKIQAEMQALPCGKGFFFQGGWSNKGSSGHSIVYEIIKEKEENLFTLRLYNRGSGVEKYHSESIIDSKRYVLPFTEIVHIPSENLSRPSILKALKELHEIPLQNNQWDSEIIYQLVLPRLGGQLSDSSYTLEQAMESLNTGHCSYLSLTGLVSEHLKSPFLYQHWEFELQFTTLTHFFQKYRQGVNLTQERTHRLLKKGTEQFARNAKEAFLQEVISIEEMELALERIEEIQAYLKLEEEGYLKGLAEQAKPPFVVDKGNLVWGKETAILQKISEIEESPVVDLNVRPLSLNQFYKDFKFYQSLIETILDHPKAGKETFLSVKEHLQRIVQQISLKKDKLEILFKNLSTQTHIIEDTISGLARMGKDYLWCILNIAYFEESRLSRVRSTDYLTLVKLLTIADFLSSRLAESHPELGVNLPSLYQWDMGYFLEGRSGDALLFNPEWEEEIRDLQTYWQKRNLEEKKESRDTSKLSFFGFEYMHASSCQNRGEENALRYLHDDPKHEEINRLGYGWPGGTHWKDLRWAIDWVSKSDVFEKIKNFDQELAKKSPVSQAIYFLYDTVEKAKKSETQPDLFPKAFFSLRDLSFAVDFILKNNWDASMKLSQNKRTAAFTAKAILSTTNVWILEALCPFSLPSFSSSSALSIREQKIENPHQIAILKKTSFSFQEPYKLNGNEFLERSQDPLPASLRHFYYELESEISPINKKIISSTFRRRVDPHSLDELSALEVSRSNTLSLQENRELFSLSGIPSQQVGETLAFFQRHPLLLQNPDYQQLFKKLMFEPPLLLNKLLNDPREANRLANRLARFCKNGYEFFSDQKDISQMAFYLEVSHLFTKTLNFISNSKDYQTLFPNPFDLSLFPQSKLELKTLLSQSTLSREERGLVALTLLQVYSGDSELAPEDVVDFLFCSIWVRKSVEDLSEPLSPFFSRQKYLITLDLPYRFQASIQKALRGERGELFLNSLASRFLGQECSWQWKARGTAYETMDGTVSILPFQSKLLEENTLSQAVVPLPKHLQKAILEIAQLETGKEYKPGYFIGKNHRGENYRLTDPGNGKEVIIYREINGKWCQKIKASFVSLPLSLNAYTLWLEDNPPSLSESVTRLFVNPVKTLWIANQAKGKLLYEVEIREGESKEEGGAQFLSYQPEAIYHLDKQGKRSGLILANTVEDNTFLQAIKQFEEGAYLLAWVNPQTRLPERIELPRLGLIFSITENKAKCLSIDGYYLAFKQHVPALGDLSHYLVLENLKGKRIVLFPCRPLKKTEEGTLITKSLPAPFKNKETIRYLTFDLSEKGDVLPRTQEGWFYLAMLHLSEQDYDLARECLFKLGAQIGEFKTEEEKVLKWILEMGRGIADSHPTAAAIRLKAGFLLLKNKEEFGQGMKLAHDRVIVDALLELSIYFVQKHSQIPLRFRLTPIEEKFLLEKLNKFFQLPEILKERKLELEGVSENRPTALTLEEINELDLRIESLLGELRFWPTFADWTAVNVFKESFPNESLLFAKGLSVNFLSTYRKIELIKQLKLKEERPPELLSLYQDLYFKIIGLQPPENFTLEAIENEILISLELILRGKSEEKERLIAAILLVQLQSSYSLPKSDKLESMLKDRQLAQLQKAFSEPLRNFLTMLPSKNLKASTLGVVDYFQLQVKSFFNSFFYLGNWEKGKEPSYPSVELKISPKVDLLPAKNLIRGIPPSKEEVKALQERGEELQKVFNGNLVGLVKSEMAILREKIASFIQSQSAEPIYEINLEENIINYLSSSIQGIEGKLELLEQEILTLARKDPTCTLHWGKQLDPRREQLKVASELASNDRLAIQLNELIYLFVGRDRNKLSQRNLGLLKEDMEKIYSLTGEYLIQATWKQHLSRQLAQVKKLELIDEELRTKNTEVHAYKGLKQALIERTDDLKLIENDHSLLSYFKIKELKNSIHALYDSYKVPKVNLDQKDLFYSLTKKLDQEIREKEKAISLLQQEIAISKNNLVDLEATERAYSFEKHPEYLVFEYFTNTFLRKDQVKNIEKLELAPHSISQKGTALEMMMGTGKTSVLLPLLALKNAEEGFLSVLIMPEPLVNSISDILRKQLREGFNRMIEVVNFTRKRRLDLQALKHEEQRFLTAKEEKKVVLLSGASLQTLFLSFLERILELSEKQTEKTQFSSLLEWFGGIEESEKLLIEEVKVYKCIFSHLREFGNFTLDEIDSLLDVLKAHHFTLGPPTSFPIEITETVTELYRLLVSQEFSREIKWNFLPTSSSTTPFTLTNYTKIRPFIIQAIVDGKICKDSLATFLKETDEEQKSLISDYLSGKNTEKNEAYKYIEKLPYAVKVTLAILKEELNKLLPLTAKKQIDEHYGAIPEKVNERQNSKYMAIPYHGSNNPSISSQFGTDLEIINYTIQMHLAKGIKGEFIQKKLNELKRRFLEATDDRSRNLVTLEFLDMGGTREMNLLNLSASQFNQIQSYINSERNRDIQLEFIRNYILPDLKTYARQLKVNSHLFPLLAKKLKGFSGILWNYRSFPKVFSFFFFSDTEPKTLLHLWQKSPHEVQVLKKDPQQVGIREALKNIYANFSGSLIDSGGIFRGFSNHQIAGELLDLISSKNKEVKGVAFYDENEEIRIQIDSKKNPVSLSESGLTKEQIIVFWDQKHTTGSDIALDSKMKAYVTVGRHLLMRDFLQGCLRLRGVDKEQQVIFLILPEEQEVIAETLRKELGRRVSAVLNLEDLFLYTKHNEIVRQGEDNYRSLRQKLEAVLIEQVLRILFEEEDSISHLAPLIRELFTYQKNKDLFETYGMPEKLYETEEAIQIEKERIFNSETMKFFQKDPYFSKKVNVCAIKKRIKEILAEEKKHLPSTIQSRGKEINEVEVQVETQLDVNTDVAIKTDSQAREKIKARPVALWPMRTHYSLDYFKPAGFRGWSQGRFLPTLMQPPALSWVAELLPPDQTLQQLSSPPPLIAIQDLLSNLNYKEEEFFDSKLLTTLNIMPVYPQEKSLAIDQFFNEYQLTNRNALIVYDQATREMHYVMLGAWDVLQWESLLKKEKIPAGAMGNQLCLCLYHWDLGITAEGEKAFPEKILLEKGSPFHGLNAQAKFLSGEIKNYSEEELLFLEKWIKKQGVSAVYAFFKEKVLSGKERSQENLPSSTLGKLFTQLRSIAQRN